jgi:hypothetical protein
MEKLFIADALIMMIVEPHGIDYLLDTFALIEAPSLFGISCMFLLYLH